MSAKEMFEKLGYEQFIKNDVIYYHKTTHIPKAYGGTIIYHINFILKDKELFASKNLDYKELQAINKQIEELGWND
jgi:hypothetical protein